MSDLAIHEARVTRVCFSTTPDASDLDALGSPDRWLTYRRMVRARFEKVLRAALPRTLALLGSSFETSFATWLQDAPPRTRLFREIPAEFAQHARSHIVAAALEAEDTMSYELAIWRVLSIDERGTPDAIDVSFEARPLMNPAVEQIDVSHPVHRPSEPQSAEGLWHLCIYRNAENKAVTLVLNGLANDLVKAWREGDETLTESVQRVAASRGDGIGPKFVDSLGSMLANYLERGLLLGCQP